LQVGTCVEIGRNAAMAVNPANYKSKGSISSECRLRTFRECV
jgi:hypothetical protein